MEVLGGLAIDPGTFLSTFQVLAPVNGDLSRSLRWLWRLLKDIPVNTETPRQNATEEWCRDFQAAVGMLQEAMQRAEETDLLVLPIYPALEPVEAGLSRREDKEKLGVAVAKATRQTQAAIQTVAEGQKDHQHSLERIAAAIEAHAESAREKGRESMEQPCALKDPNYLPLKEARKLIDDRFSLSTLSKLVTPDGEIRYMRKPGVGCRLHVADFMRYMHEGATERPRMGGCVHELAERTEGRQVPSFLALWILWP